MSYVSSYPRRPRYSNVGFNDYEPNTGYPGEYYEGDNYNYGGGYQNYQRPEVYTPHRRNSYNSRYGGQIQVLPSGSQVITGDGRHYSGNEYYSSGRHGRGPVVVSGGGRYGRHQPHLSSSSRYYASNSRGDHIPVIEGESYHHGPIPFWTYVRRIFGLGPRRSRDHVGRTIHVRRWDDLGDLLSFTRPRRRHRSHTSLYTI